MKLDPQRDKLADEALVKLVLEGDEPALTTLYRRYVDAIYRFILAQVRDRQTAEDLCSDTFARMLRGLGSFRGEASFKNWLYQIARNALRNHRRSASYRRTIALAPSLADDSAPADEADEGLRERALAILAPLPPRYRQVLELRFLVGCTIEETARRMGITKSNAKVLQHRALKKASQGAQEQEQDREARSARR